MTKNIRKSLSGTKLKQQKIIMNGTKRQKHSILDSGYISFKNYLDGFILYRLKVQLWKTKHEFNYVKNLINF